MAENVLRRPNVRLLPSDQQTAERMPQVVKSEPLSRPEDNPGLDCRWPQMIGGERIAHARIPCKNFFTCNFTCKKLVLAVLARAKAVSDAF
jgi:hypothetical protein